MSYAALVRLECDWSRCPTAAGAIGEREAVDREARLGGWLLEEDFALCPVHKRAWEEYERTGLLVPSTAGGPLGPRIPPLEAGEQIPADPGEVETGPAPWSPQRRRRGAHVRDNPFRAAAARAVPR